MAQFEQHFIQDLTQQIKVRHCGSIVFNADNESNVVSVRLFNGSEPVAISGSVVGAVVCSDGSTVPLTGSYSGNTASVTLTGDCFAVLGQIGVGIQIVNGTQKTTVLKVIYNVETITTENVVDPGSRITLSVSDLIDDIETAVASIPADYSDLLAAIAPNYSGLTFPVKAGTFCWYNGALYQAQQGITTSEAWTAAHWASAVLTTSLGEKLADVDDELSDLKSAMNSLYLEFDVNIQNTSTYKYQLKPTAGTVYTVTNGCSAGLAVWTMNASQQTVDSFSAIAVGATKDITIVHDAEYLAFYCSGTGSVHVADNTTIIPVLSGRVSENEDELGYLNGFVVHDPETNLIDTTRCVSGYINGGVDGSVVSNSTFYCTDFIPVEEGIQYYYNNSYIYRGYCAFYNTNKEYISGIGTSSSSVYLGSPFVVPSGSKYMRLTIISQAAIENAWVCTLNQMANKPPVYSDMLSTGAVTRPTNYTGNEIDVFTKILCIGDSLTEGFFNESGGSRLVMENRSFPAKLQALTGIECTNLGESGLTSAQWYTAHGSDDLSGHDACIIQLGVNDQLNSVSESDMDSALTSIINKVKTDNTGIKIFVATIIPCNGYMTTAMRTRSQMIRDFVAGLNDDNVYLLDMWAYGNTDDLLAYDSGHLSALGYLRLAEDYKSYISYVIRNNADDFRYVQFIGTNYSYSGDTDARMITY